MATSLFEKYGGFAEVRKIVADFYDEVLEDELLAHHFASVNMRRLIDHQTKMISAILDGPAYLTVEQLGRAHAALDITSAEFDRLAEIMATTLEDHAFEAGDTMTVLARIEDVREIILEEAT